MDQFPLSKSSSSDEDEDDEDASDESDDDDDDGDNMSGIVGIYKRPLARLKRVTACYRKIGMLHYHGVGVFFTIANCVGIECCSSEIQQPILKKEMASLVNSCARSVFILNKFITLIRPEMEGRNAI